MHLWLDCKHYKIFGIYRPFPSVNPNIRGQFGVADGRRRVGKLTNTDVGSFANVTANGMDVGDATSANKFADGLAVGNCVGLIADVFVRWQLQESCRRRHLSAFCSSD